MISGDVFSFLIGVALGIIACSLRTSHPVESSAFAPTRIGRSLLSLDSQPGKSNWAVVYDSEREDKELQDQHEEVVLGNIDDGKAPQLLSNELNTLGFLHASILCTGNDDNIEVTRKWWDHRTYFHTSSHLHVFQRRSSDDVTFAVSADHLPVYLIKHLCSSLLDRYKWHAVVDDQTYIKFEELEDYLLAFNADTEYIIANWTLHDGIYDIDNRSGMVFSQSALKSFCPFVNMKVQPQGSDLPWPQRILRSFRGGFFQTQPLNNMTVFGSYGKAPLNALITSSLADAHSMRSMHSSALRQRFNIMKRQLEDMETSFKDLVVTVRQETPVESHLVERFHNYSKDPIPDLEVDGMSRCMSEGVHIGKGFWEGVSEKCEGFEDINSSMLCVDAQDRLQLDFDVGEDQFTVPVNFQIIDVHEYVTLK